MPSACAVLVLGGGPAGLRAAELLSAAGHATVLADRMPSVGRKFLVAGRGGLNLTHSEPLENFPARYGTELDRWTRLLADFTPTDLRAWAAGLGVETFVGTSGRVFPEGKKAAPLLRRWVERLRRQGVRFALRHRWTGLEQQPNGGFGVALETPDGPVIQQTRAVVLALGGGSWPQTGSDGAWLPLLEKKGVSLVPLAPANGGYEVAWPADFLAAAEGAPLKNLIVRAGSREVAGELLVTRYGLEGGAIYQLGRELRAMAEPCLEIDLKPTFTAEQLSIRLAAATTLLPRAGLEVRMARAWKLSPAALALLQLRGPFASESAAARAAKTISIALLGPRPLAEAISTAGGVSWNELDNTLMLRRWPGLFCAGEMVDWEAPTGGYLLHGCLATATRAAKGADEFLDRAQKKKLPSGPTAP